MFVLLIVVMLLIEFYCIIGWGVLEGYKVFYYEIYINFEVVSGFIE